MVQLTAVGRIGVQRNQSIGPVIGDDDLNLSIAADAASVDEGETGTFTVTINRALTDSESVLVNYTVTGTGGATSDDWTDENGGQIVIDAPDQTGIISIQVINDADEDEDGEGITVTLDDFDLLNTEDFGTASASMTIND